MVISGNVSSSDVSILRVYRGSSSSAAVTVYKTLQEVLPSDDPADLIFMEPELLSVHPSEDAYQIAQRRAMSAVKIFRGTHPDAIYLSREIQSLRIPDERRLADLIKV